MLSLFKTNSQPWFSKPVISEPVVEKPAIENVVIEKQPIISSKPKTEMDLLIDEIHDSFYTEVNKLLADANISKSLETDKQYLINKCNRLKALGFTSTKEVKEAEAEIARLEKVKLENENKKQLIDAINYFTQNYPSYKFITKESVKKICSKYGLAYGPVGAYTGEVPEVNLKHIENFRIRKIDEAYIQTKSSFGSIESRYVHHVDYQKHVEYKKTDRYVYDFSVNEIEKLPLQIAAPIKDFDKTKMNLSAFELPKKIILDPVVLCPVIFRGVIYYLIVTAWGQEAGDALVMNPRHN